MSYEVIGDEKTYFSIVNQRWNLIKDIEVVCFGSTKVCSHYEDLRITTSDFDEEYIILKVAPEFKGYRIILEGVTVLGRAISYKLIGWAVKFKIGEETYYVLFSSHFYVSAENQSFSLSINKYVSELLKGV